MHISEALYKLKQLPPDATLTAQHLVAFLEAITPLTVDKAAIKSPTGNDNVNIEDLQTVDEKKVAEILGMSVETVRYWRKVKSGPAYIKDPNGKAVRYKISVLRDYMEQNTVKPHIATLTFHPPIMLYGNSEVDFFTSISMAEEPTGYKVIKIDDELVLSADTQAKIANYLGDSDV